MPSRDIVTLGLDLPNYTSVFGHSQDLERSRRICKSVFILTRPCTGLISIYKTTVLDSQSLHYHVITRTNAQFIKNGILSHVKIFYDTYLHQI